ncbi:MAG: hypothetical protein AB7F89_12210 [Pirellulaceae bacterium]
MSPVRLPFNSDAPVASPATQAKVWVVGLLTSLAMILSAGVSALAMVVGIALRDIPEVRPPLPFLLRDDVIRMPAPIDARPLPVTDDARVTPLLRIESR